MKYYDIEEKKQFALSPSMRREWIEMVNACLTSIEIPVSLHAEGVD